MHDEHEYSKKCGEQLGVKYAAAFGAFFSSLALSDIVILLAVLIAIAT